MTTELGRIIGIVLGLATLAVALAIVIFVFTLVSIESKLG